MPSTSFQNLVVWQKAIVLAEEVYRVTRALPREELYGLVSQMRRAAVSIPSNIAEGRLRGSAKDFVQFLRIASGSAAELETQFFLSKKLFPSPDAWNRADQLLGEIQKMLFVMVARLSHR